LLALPALTSKTNLFAPIALTLETYPPVKVVIGKSPSGYWWVYDYEGCKPIGAFFNYQSALQDAITYSTDYAD
tara:strand:+ start:68 stop:286 length:219 start_codon:yes stop_codon:yes gene_type:complete